MSLLRNGGRRDGNADAEQRLSCHLFPMLYADLDSLLPTSNDQPRPGKAGWPASASDVDGQYCAGVLGRLDDETSCSILDVCDYTLLIDMI